MTEEEKRTFWLECIKAYHSSNMSAVKWCKENNISVHILRKWITKINKENKNSVSKDWVPVDVSSESKENNENPSKYSSSISINIGSASIDVPSDFDPKALETIVEILSKKC